MVLEKTGWWEFPSSNSFQARFVRVNYCKENSEKYTFRGFKLWEKGHSLGLKGRKRKNLVAVLICEQNFEQQREQKLVKK